MERADAPWAARSRSRWAWRRVSARLGSLHAGAGGERAGPRRRDPGALLRVVQPHEHVAGVDRGPLLHADLGDPAEHAGPDRRHRLGDDVPGRRDLDGSLRRGDHLDLRDRHLCLEDPRPEQDGGGGEPRSGGGAQQHGEQEPHAGAGSMGLRVSVDPEGGEVV